MKTHSFSLVSASMHNVSMISAYTHFFSFFEAYIIFGNHLIKGLGECCRLITTEIYSTLRFLVHV